jgi:hypothetical protein
MHRWKDNFKINPQKRKKKGMDWIHVTQCRDMGSGGGGSPENVNKRSRSTKDGEFPD